MEFKNLKFNNLIFDDRCLNSSIFYFKDNEDNFIELVPISTNDLTVDTYLYVVLVFEECSRVDAFIVGSNSDIEKTVDKYMKPYIEKWSKDVS